jgi:hypothetical protein
VNEDRITYDQLSQLTDGRDRPAAHAIDTAGRGRSAASGGWALIRLLGVSPQGDARIRI